MSDQLKIGAPDGQESGGVASGGVPASPVGFKGNKTIGRIKTLECLKSSDPKACEKAHLDELSQRYADHASGKMPLPPGESLELRAQIQKLDSELYPDRTSLWPDYSPAEKDYLAQKAAEKRRFANNIGILGGGLVFAGLPAMGRVLNAPEDVVEQLGVLNVELVGAFGLRGYGQRVIKPVPNKPETVLVYRKQAGRAKGTYVEKPVPKHSPGSRLGSEEEKKLLAERQSFLQEAESPYKGQPLTQAGRATTKHPEYFGFDNVQELRAVYRTDAQLNDLASKSLNDVLSNGTRTAGAGGRYPNGWVTYTLPNGNAASWRSSGEFIGFRGVQK